MAKQNVGRTALGAATCRLIEQYQPGETRLFNDPVAKELVGAPIRFLLQFAGMRNLTLQQTEAVTKGIYGAQICRTRYIDEVLQENSLSQGIKQLVILGAGYDTRPYRLPGLERVKVFEVDLPQLQADKKKKIQKHSGRLPENVTFAPIDFGTQSLESVFVGTAFDPSQPAAFIWEGVTQYISAEAVGQSLAFVGRCAPGSLILFTYILKSIIERRSDIPDANKMLDVVGKYAPWVFGLEPSDIRVYLQPFHLDLVADVGNAEYQEKYLKPLKRDLAVFEGERIAQAVVAHP